MIGSLSKQCGNNLKYLFTSKKCLCGLGYLFPNIKQVLVGFKHVIYFKVTNVCSCAIINQLVIPKIKTAFKAYCNTLGQACTTYGPWAKCGPRKLLIWPAKPQILFILLLFWVKSPFECVKTC